MKLAQDVQFLDLVIPAGTVIPNSRITKLPKAGKKMILTVKDYVNLIATQKILPQNHNRGLRGYSKETSDAIVTDGLNADVLSDCIVGYPTASWCNDEKYEAGDWRREVAHLTGFHSRTHGILRKFLENSLSAKDMAAEFTLTMVGSEGFELAYRQQGMGGQEHRTIDRITNPHLAIGEWWHKLNKKLGPVISKKLIGRTQTIGTIIQAIGCDHQDWNWHSIYRCRGNKRDLSNEKAGTLKISDNDIDTLVSAITYWFVLSSQAKKYCNNDNVVKFMCNAGVLGFIVTDRFAAAAQRKIDKHGKLVSKNKSICRSNTELLATIISENIGTLERMGTDLCKEKDRAAPAIKTVTEIFNKKLTKDKEYYSRFTAPQSFKNGFSQHQIKEILNCSESTCRLWMTEEQASIGLKEIKHLWPNAINNAHNAGEKAPFIDVSRQNQEKFRVGFFDREVVSR